MQSTKRPRTQLEQEERDQEVNRLKLKLEEQKLQHETERKRDRLALQNVESIRDKLQRQVVFLTQEEKTARDLMRGQGETLLNEKHQLENRLLELQSKILELEEDKRSASFLSEVPANGALEREFEIFRMKDHQQVSKISMLEDEVKSLHVQLAKSREQSVEKPRRPFAQLSGEDVKITDNSRQLRAQLQDAEIRERKLVQQLHALQAASRNVEIQEEQKKQLLEKLQKAEAVITAHGATQARYEALQNEQQMWQEQFRGLLSQGNAGVTAEQITPLKAASLLQNMRQEQAVLLRRQGELEAKITALRRQGAETKDEVLEEGKRRASAEQKAAQLEEKLQAAQNENSYLSQKKSSLEKLLESYDAEFSVMKSGGTPNPERSARADSLEREMQAAEKQIQDLKQQLETKSAPAELLQANKRIEDLEQAVKGSEADKGKVLGQLEKAEKELASLEARMCRGEYNRSTTKVLHFAMNPSHAVYSKHKEAQGSSLEKENQALKAKIAQLEQVAAAPVTSSAEVSSSSSSASSSAPAPSSDVVEGLKLRNQRLIEMFRTKLQTFREAVYLTTGFKVDMTQDSIPQLRLRSMYAEHEEDDIRFQMSPDGLELLETAFCSSLDENAFAYLTRCDSIPSFLGTVTLSLFDKQTIALK